MPAHPTSSRRAPIGAALLVLASLALGCPGLAWAQTSSRRTAVPRPIKTAASRPINTESRPRNTVLRLIQTTRPAQDEPALNMPDGLVPENHPPISSPSPDPLPEDVTPEDDGQSEAPSRPGLWRLFPA